MMVSTAIMRDFCDTPVGIAGSGKVARALGRLLRQAGARITALAGRSPEGTRQAARFICEDVEPVGLAELPSRAAHVLVAVSDAAITPVADLLAGAGLHRGIALHTCGGMGPEALAPLAKNGVECGALHPLQTVSGPEQGVRDLPGAAFAICGSDAAEEWGAWLARRAGGVPIRIDPERRACYHAAAVMASNYLVGLVDAASTLMQQAGLSAEEALRALGPLARASLENALRAGPAEALTGPIARGDAATIRMHLRALPGPLQGLYRAAGLQVLELARGRNLTPEAVREIRQLLENGESK